MKKSKIPSLVTVAYFTLVTSIVWVAFSVYRVLTSKPDPTVPPEILAPISPTLNKSQIDNIESRIYYSNSDGQIPIPTTHGGQTPTPTIRMEGGGGL
jgi:hypothetical protein